MANFFDQFDAQPAAQGAVPAPNSSTAPPAGNFFDQFDQFDPKQPLAQDLSSLTQNAGAPPTQYSNADSAIGGWVDNMTFGTADELGAGIDYAADHILPSGKSRPYSEFLADERQALGQAKAQHPVAYLGGQVAGAVTGGVGLAKGGLSVGAKVAQGGGGWFARLLGGAADGGIQSGLYGAGSANGDARDRVAAGLHDAPMGAGFGLAGEGLAMGIGASINRAFRGPGISNAERAAAANSAKAAGEFNIPLSRAQATGSSAQAATEADLRAQGRMQDFDASQAAAVDRAASDFQGTLAGRGDRVASPSEAFGDAQTALRQRRDALKAQSQDAYARSIDDPSVTVPGQAIEELPGFVRGRLAQENIVVDPQYNVGASKALDYMDRHLAMMPRPGGSASGVTAQLKYLENLRAGIRKNFPPIGPDASALSSIKNSLDTFVDKLFDHNLVSGSDEVLADLKAARANWSEYKNTINPRAKTGDRLNPTYAAQARVRDITAKDMSPDEIGKYLFGSNVANPKAMSWATARELKRQLGPDSQAWNGIRQAFWLRATRAGDDTLHADKIAANLKSFLQENKGVATELYSKAELAAMNRFAGVVNNLKHVRPGEAGTNTANKLLPVLAKHAQDIMGALVAGVGYHFGVVNPLEAIGAGAAARAVTSPAMAIGDAIRQRALTTTATMRPVPALPSGVAGGAIRGAVIPIERARREPLRIDVHPLRKAS